MTRNYKDYTIRVNEIDHPNYGMGYRAEMFIAKNDGLKANIIAFEIYRKMKPGEVVALCQEIIDLN